MHKRSCESGEPRALKAHRSPRCRERSFGSLRSVKLFFGVFEKKERFLARRGSAIGLPCSAARRLSPSGPSACPRTRSARIHPIFVFEEKKEKKTRSPSCLCLFFRAFPPELSRRPGAPPESASAIAGELRTARARRSSRAPGQLPPTYYKVQKSCNLDKIYAATIETSISRSLRAVVMA